VTAFRSVTATVMDEAVAGIPAERIAGVIELLSTMRANLTGKATGEPDPRTGTRTKESASP